MNRLPTLFAVFLGLSLASANAQTTDRKPAPSRLAGSWQVSYEDLALGEVDGTATFSSDGKSVNVTLRRDGTSYQLASQSIVEQGDDYTIVLTGDSPASATLLPDAQTQLEGPYAERDSYAAALRANSLGKTGAAVPQPNLAPPALPSIPAIAAPASNYAKSAADSAPDIHITVADDVTTINLSSADYRGEADFLARHPVETHRVELRLHFYKNGGVGANTGVVADRLTGSWRFFADPVTRRDGDGKGRVGLFRRDEHNPNFATQSGAELWLRPVPPARLQFFAIGVFNWKRISQLYLGVPTVVEAIFDEAQERDTCPIEVGSLKLTAHRDPDNWRRFVSDPFVPGPEPPR